ncbi:MAG TPA: MaoC/PaaZ C-terminal domain-containing protein [Dehalococcoidia bacterium]|nr:MaoC/PaaZ C-terminal domain-containing protein [Dehalococcoidia bacterium]
MPDLPLKPGDTVRFTKTVTDAVVRQFAEASGDDQPLHLDETFGTRTRFKGRIAHGMLSAGFISAALGTRPPAGSSSTSRSNCASARPSPSATRSRRSAR